MGWNDPRVQVTNKQRDRFEAEVKGWAANSRAASDRSSGLSSPRTFTSSNRPSLSDRKPPSSAITFQTALWRSFKWLHGK